MRILAVETSCDETSIAIVDHGKDIIALHTAGQETYHRAFGGVVPEIAARRHLELLFPSIKTVLNKLKKNGGMDPHEALQDIDAIAVTTHPGLIGSLLTGVQAAKTLAYVLKKPLIAVSHLRAHFYSLFMSSSKSKTLTTPPFLALLVSGGHTLLAELRSPMDIEILGSTLDDACGECFDKIARALALPYPGGPALEDLATRGDPNAFAYPIFKNKDRENPYAMSYSGLKTAVLYQSPRYARNKETATELARFFAASSSTSSTHPDLSALPPKIRADIAASFQKAAFDQLIDRLCSAMDRRPKYRVGICGGVAANAALRKQIDICLTQKAAERNAPHPIKPAPCLVPPLSLCGDNAAMIGGLAYHYYCHGEVVSDLLTLEPQPATFKKHGVL